MLRVDRRQKEDPMYNIKELRIVHDEAAANILLNDGWHFIQGGIYHVDDMGYVTKPYVMLARECDKR